MPRRTSLACGLLATLTLPPALADNHIEAPTFFPVEMHTCNYVGNADRADLDRVIAKYNKWADKHDQTYSAWTLTPNFVNPKVTMDIGWLGAWSSGMNMGKSLDTWREKGNQADFDKVLSCDSHNGAAAVNVKPLPEGDAPEGSLVTFSSCTLAEGITPDKAYESHLKMSAWWKSQESTAGTWLFYPGYGSGSTDMDYYVVAAYANYTELGKDFERFTNGGGWMKAAEFFDGVADCDGARVYEAKLVRSGTE